MQQLEKEACGLTNQPETIDLPLSSPKRTVRTRKHRLDSSETAYSGRLLTPAEALKVPPTTRLEQRQGNPKMIRDHLVEGVTGRWNVNKKQYIWYVRGPNLQGKQVRLGTYLCQKKARRVQQKAVDEYTKVRFLSEFSDLSVDCLTTSCPSTVPAQAKETAKAPEATSSTSAHSSNQFLQEVPVQRLPAADEPVVSFSMETIADKFYFGDSIQLCVFSCGKLIIRQMSSMHWWMPLSSNEQKRVPELVAEAMARSLGINGDYCLEHLGDHSRFSTDIGLHVTKCYGISLPTCIALRPSLLEHSRRTMWYSAIYFFAMMARATSSITLQPKLSLNWCTTDFMLWRLKKYLPELQKNAQHGQNSSADQTILGKRPQSKPQSAKKNTPRRKQKNILQQDALKPNRMLSMTVKQKKI